MSNSKWIWHYAKKSIGFILLTILILVLEILSNIGLTGIQKFIIDDLIMKQNMDLLLPLLSGLAGLAVLYNVLHLIAAQTRNKAVFVILRSLLSDMVHYLHQIPVKIFRKERTAKYVKNLTQDINTVSQIPANQIPVGIMQVVNAITLSLLVGLANPVILLSIMCISVLYIFFGRKFAPKLKTSVKETEHEKSNLLVTIEEGIASSREVIAFHRQDWERQRFLEKFAAYFRKVMNLNKLENRQTLFSLPLRWCVQLIVLGYGGYLVMTDSMSIGMFVVVFQFSTQLLVSYEAVFNVVMNLSKSGAIIDRVREVMDGDRLFRGKQALNDKIVSMEFHKVHFQYEDDGQKVLQDLTFTIPIGKNMETERQVQENLDILREGKTTIVIAHRLSTILNADIIYVLNEGRVVEQGNYEELLNKDGYFKKLLQYPRSPLRSSG